MPVNRWRCPAPWSTPGRRRWKNALHLRHQRTEKRITAQTVPDVLAEAAHVEAELERDEHCRSARVVWTPVTP